MKSYSIAIVIATCLLAMVCSQEEPSSISPMQSNANMPKSNSSKDGHDHSMHVHDPAVHDHNMMPMPESSTTNPSTANNTVEDPSAQGSGNSAQSLTVFLPLAAITTGFLFLV